MGDYLELTPVVLSDQLQDSPEVGEKLVMFHNGQGPMSKDAEAFLADLGDPIREHQTDEKSIHTLLGRSRIHFPPSDGVSDAYAYFPTMRWSLRFLKPRADDS